MTRSLCVGLWTMIALIVFACGTQGPVSPELTQSRQGIFRVKPIGDPSALVKMSDINEQLTSQRLNYRVEAIEFFTIGVGRPNDRLHQEPFRWVPNDSRRLAHGIDITYLVDRSDGRTASGLSSSQTEAAIDRALTTWDTDPALSKVAIVKRTDDGADPDVYDSFFGFGKLGTPFLADIVNAGWLPRALFEAVGGPGGGSSILAFTVSFIFVDPLTGVPTDINGDNYLDTAFSEIYYNNTFGQAKTDPADNPWGINIALPGFDVETVALHENGHALELGHFGPPPDAVMNPVYAGIRLFPLPPDRAGMHAVWSSWPNP